MWGKAEFVLKMLHHSALAGGPGQQIQLVTTAEHHLRLQTVLLQCVAHPGLKGRGRFPLERFSQIVTEFEAALLLVTLQHQAIPGVKQVRNGPTVPIHLKMGVPDRIGLTAPEQGRANTRCPAVGLQKPLHLLQLPCGKQTSPRSISQFEAWTKRFQTAVQLFQRFRVTHQGVVQVSHQQQIAHRSIPRRVPIMPQRPAIPQTRQQTNSKNTKSREEKIIQAAEAHFERTLVTVQGQVVGAAAALEHPGRGDSLNYEEIFLRDNVPVMFHLLLKGRYRLVRHFLVLCMNLQSGEHQTRGLFPTSFIEENGALVADYGQRSIGRISSVDASLWWPILCWFYVSHSKDLQFGIDQQVQRAVQRLLDLVMQPSFEGTPVLFVPDCSFMIDRPMDVWGAPLEVQVLLYGCLKACVKLMEHAQEVSPSPSRLLSQRVLLTREWIHRLRSYLLKHYWVTSKTIQVLRRRPTEQYGDVQYLNEFNVQPSEIPHWLQDWLDDRGGYLIGNVRTGRPDYRFFTLGNSLACIFGLLTVPQQRALFRLILRNRNHLMAQMPMRICHPPLEGQEWATKTGSDPKNWPWSYHNGGHWPSLLWYLVLAVILHEQNHPRSDVVLVGQIKALLEQAYQTHLATLPRQQWAEYFDGPTGTWVGQQARLYQTWSIVGLLLTHQLLRKGHAIDLSIDLGHEQPPK